MSWTKWLPLRYIIRRAARSQGFLDPIELMARLRSFAQPSEVGEPVELLRAGVVFHARGLINSKVIQNNLDWVWPYWIERQFNPHDNAFIPRAFSVSHINLTHRNWTALGYPDGEELSLVDPRGLLTPFYDAWSIDSWIINEDGRSLLPSRVSDCDQQQNMESGLSITTRSRSNGMELNSSASELLESGKPVCRLELTARSDSRAWLAVSLRPCNPEGISFIHEVSLSPDRRHWTIDDKRTVEFSRPAERHHISDYHNGDVYIGMLEREERMKAECDRDMLTAVALFPIEAGKDSSLTVRMPLDDNAPAPDAADWSGVREPACKFECPEPHYRFLYDAAVTSLILHSPHDVYPGPYTYKRFWFRDAAFIIHALLCAGLTDRAERAFSTFQQRQNPLGYFRSQEGEWDANGEVLWILYRYEQLTGRRLDSSWISPIKRGARWILRKRLSDDIEAPHAGLMPAGFSAEHLGPNDYYYWDDFWSIAGLRAAEELLQGHAEDAAAESFAQAADDFAASVDRSLASCAQRLGRPGMPASPYRRMDAGAIGSLAVGYPLQDSAPDDPRLLDCVEFLLDKCFVDGAFFQDMIHSGLNAYLTLHVAQILLRAGDPRYLDLMDTVAQLASPTGQWPEAIHPRTKGGCMGDGHHVWAAAEWVLMIRNCFVREEEDGLILCGGIPARWLEQEDPIRFGPAPTAFGPVSIEMTPHKEKVQVDWKAQWRDHEPEIEIRVPGHETVRADAGTGSVTLHRNGNAA